MKNIILPSYAKVNLYLKIIEKLPDGYHNIQTIFQTISLKDEISITLTQGNNIEISSDSKDIPINASNLAYQAAMLVLDKLNIKSGLKIHISKNIPVAAGLGGGSSNAASCIFGLNKLLNANLSRRKMFKIAACLGSDVPFFILKNSCALGKGKGQIVKKLNKIPKYWFILICPNIKVSTEVAYNEYKLNLTKKKPSVKMCIRALRSNDLRRISSVLYNDLEQVVEEKYKQIKDIKERLKQIGIKATLTSGSGPCVFGMLKSKEEAMQSKEEIETKSGRWAVYVSCSK